MSLSKQLLIQDHLRVYKIDILACQEVSVNNDTFNNCDFISANYTLVSNNSHNEFGTLFLIKNNFPINDIYMDTEGRAICINLGDFTVGIFTLSLALMPFAVKIVKKCSLKQSLIYFLTESNQEYFWVIGIQ